MSPHPSGSPNLQLDTIESSRNETSSSLFSLFNFLPGNSPSTDLKANNYLFTVIITFYYYYFDNNNNSSRKRNQSNCCLSPLTFGGDHIEQQLKKFGQQPLIVICKQKPKKMAKILCNFFFQKKSIF